MLSEEGTRQTSSFMHDFLHVIVELWMNISSSCLPCVKHIWMTIYFARRVAPANITCLDKLIKYLRGHDALRTTSVFSSLSSDAVFRDIYRIEKYCIQSPVPCWCRTPDTLSVVASHWQSRDWCGHQQHSHYQSPPTRHPWYS